MLKLSIEKPTKVSPKGFHGYARYRIDFENLRDGDYYILGWVTPWTTRFGLEIEAREFLFNMDGWKQGLVKEIYQDNLLEVQHFKVRLYRAGLIPIVADWTTEEPEGFLLEEKEFGAQVPLD